MLSLYRTKAMEAQCFDPALKSRSNSSVLPKWVAGDVQETYSGNSINGTDIVSTTFAHGTLKSSFTTLLHDPYTKDLSPMLQSFPTDISSPSSTCSTPDLEPENDSPELAMTDLEGGVPFEELEDAHSCSDYAVVESEEYTTCKIIRPLPGFPPRSPLLSLLSRPCSPFSIFSRPGSPISFSNLNCMKSTDNLEDDVSLFQDQRAAAHRRGLEIFVSRHQEVRREQAWRASFHEYFDQPDMAQGQIRILTGPAAHA